VKSPRAGHQTDFAPTDILEQFTTPLPLLETPPAAPRRPAPAKARPARDTDQLTSELFERMSAILQQTEAIRHEQKNLSPALKQHIAHIEEECAEAIQLLVTLSDGATA
jgi:hypothetical protein